MNTFWNLKKAGINVSLMAKTLGINENLASLIANRNIKTKNEAIKYLKPSKKYFHKEPIKGFEEAKTLLLHSKEKKICIYGDYDVDGVMSVSILYKMLKKEQGEHLVSYYTPHRIKEGYGLNKEAVQKLHKEGVELLILVDNGIVAIEEIELCGKLGIKTIIIDHHEPSPELPSASVIINPKQIGCTYPFKEMCAAGLVYRFSIYFTNRDLDEFLIYATIATICDVVDLVEDNRIIVSEGLHLMKDIENFKNKGLLELLKLVNKTDEITEETIGYYLGPALNAAGRLDSALKAIKLIVDEDELLASEIAELNAYRKELLKEAENFEIEEENPFLVVHLKELHESLAGILAGRIADKYNKPTLVLTGDEVLKGSARSVEGFNLYKALAENKPLFKRFGGHEMAAGLTMPFSNLDKLKENLFSLNYKNTQKIINIDEEQKLKEATYTKFLELQFLRPFGRKNPRPTFLTKNIEISELRVMEEKSTLIFTFTKEDFVIKGICFGMVDYFKEKIYENFSSFQAEKITHGILRGIDLYVDIVYHIEVNSFRGNKYTQIRVLDFIIKGNNIKENNNE